MSTAYSEAEADAQMLAVARLHEEPAPDRPSVGATLSQHFDREVKRHR